MNLSVFMYGRMYVKCLRYFTQGIFGFVCVSVNVGVFMYTLVLFVLFPSPPPGFGAQDNAYNKDACAGKNKC